MEITLSSDEIITAIQLYMAIKGYEFTQTELFMNRYKQDYTMILKDVESGNVDIETAIRRIEKGIV